MICCIFEHGIKGLCLSFFSTNFSNLRLKAAELLLILYVYPPPPFVIHIFNVFINIYEYANKMQQEYDRPMSKL